MNGLRNCGEHTKRCRSETELKSSGSTSILFLWKERAHISPHYRYKKSRQCRCLTASLMPTSRELAALTSHFKSTTEEKKWAWRRSEGKSRFPSPKEPLSPLPRVCSEQILSWSLVPRLLAA